jgi:arylsulfatase A-like enzyme
MEVAGSDDKGFPAYRTPPLGGNADLFVIDSFTTGDTTESVRFRPFRCGYWSGGEAWVDDLFLIEQFELSKIPRLEKAFIYLHLMDLHAPYRPPAPYNQLFTDESVPEKTFPLEDRHEAYYLPGHPGINYHINQYDGAIRYADDQLRLLFDKIEDLGLLADTTFFVTADHGEAFLEHGKTGHGKGIIFDEILRIPMIVSPNGRFERQGRIEGLVELASVYPTVMDLFGFSPSQEIAGASFLSLLSSRGNEWSNLAFMETNNVGRKRVLRSLDAKLVRDLETGEDVFYDLAGDPGEATPLSTIGKDQQRLVEILDEVLKHNEIEKTKMNLSADGEEPDSSVIEAIRGLGYLGGE